MVAVFESCYTMTAAMIADFENDQNSVTQGMWKKTAIVVAVPNISMFRLLFLWE